MPVNADKPHLWKQDIALSVDMFNAWFVEFAPAAYQDTRAQTSQRVQSALSRTSNLTDISPDVLAEEPSTGFVSGGDHSGRPAMRRNLGPNHS
jgi:hypothetical protein